jgi:hypothetical protein
MEKVPAAPREGPSPFLEGTAIQYAWDSTCLGAFKRCPRLYQLSILEGWRPKADRVHLTFGIHYTNALEAYDKLKASYAEAQGEAFHDQAVMLVVNKMMCDTWVEDHRWEHGPHDSKIGNKNFYNLLRSVIWYLDQFEHDTAETVIAEDGTPLVERSFRMELDWGPKANRTWNHNDGEKPQDWNPFQPYVLCGHLDKVVNFIGGTYVMDHKTTKSTLSSYYFDQWEPNNQMSLYTIASQVIFGGPVKGVIIDAAQILVGSTVFARGMTYRTPAQSEEWLVDLHYWLDQAEACATAEYWPMNDTACFNCDFNKGEGKICAKDPSVRRAFLEAGFTRDAPWNPLKPRN